MKIAFIGAGKMAEAIIGALSRTTIVAAEDIIASDSDPVRLEHLTSEYGISTFENNVAAAEAADVVVLAVKPQVLDTVLVELRPVVGAQTLVISIAAGKQVSYFEAGLPEARVVRVMPNLCCLVGEAASAFCCGAAVTGADKETVERLLGSCGTVLEMPEGQFDAVTAISGSGPAFFAYVLEGLVSAAESEGLSRADALLLGEQTMLGTARLLMAQKLEPNELIASVCSAKGTTAEGIGVLKQSEMRTILKDTIEAAARRSRELSSGG